MNLQIDLQLVAVAASCLACAVATATYLRGQDWRKSDTWKTLTDIVAGLGQRMNIVESRTGELPTKISTINDRLTRVEAHLDDMPCKADIAELRAKLDAQGEEIDVVRDTAIRIEDWLRNAKP